VKGSGGYIGLTENTVAFRHWILSGPELVGLQQPFEFEYLFDSDPDNPRKNHEQGLATQKIFKQQVYTLFKTIKNMGNPFQDDFSELVTLDAASIPLYTRVKLVVQLNCHLKKKIIIIIITIIKSSL